MIAIRSDLRILVTSRPVDFRRGMDSLAMLVSEALRENPFSGALFIFRSKRADRVKILAWDGSGLVLYYKRLETGRFTWPPIRDGVVVLRAAELTLLLDGLNWTTLLPNRVQRPLRAG
jgi:transposase